MSNQRIDNLRQLRDSAQATLDAAIKCLDADTASGVVDLGTYAARHFYTQGLDDNLGWMLDTTVRRLQRDVPAHPDITTEPTETDTEISQ